MILDPRPMQLQEWSAQLTLQLDKFGPVGVLLSPDDWQPWAENVIIQIGLADSTVNPFSFKDWREWAIRFLQVAEPFLP